jgi:hypothetical protein
LLGKREKNYIPRPEAPTRECTEGIGPVGESKKSRLVLVRMRVKARRKLFQKLKFWNRIC